MKNVVLIQLTLLFPVSAQTISDGARGVVREMYQFSIEKARISHALFLGGEFVNGGMISSCRVRLAVGRLFPIADVIGERGGRF